MRRPWAGGGPYISRSGLFQDLLEGQLGRCPAQPRVLGLELLQPLDLIALQPAVLRPPAVTSVTPIALTASATARPWAVSTSTCRSLATISSAVCRFLAILASSIWRNHPLEHVSQLRQGLDPTQHYDCLKNDRLREDNKVGTGKLLRHVVLLPGTIP